jgi:hypothetical protein
MVSGGSLAMLTLLHEDADHEFCEIAQDQSGAVCAAALR